MRILTIFLALSFSGAPLAHAQSASAATRVPLVRADLAGLLGWSNVRESGADPYDNWFHSIYAGAAFGWYWTDHLKTEIDFGAAAEDDLYRGRQVTIDGHPVFESARVRLSRRSVGIAQQYQFFRNAWFHPFLAGGIELAWNERREEYQPVVIYEDPGRRGEVIRPARTVGPDTMLDVRPLVVGGFKAYMTQRAFFKSDVRVAFRDEGTDEVLWRFGFGVDF